MKKLLIKISFNRNFLKQMKRDHPKNKFLKQKNLHFKRKTDIITTAHAFV